MKKWFHSRASSLGAVGVLVVSGCDLAATPDDSAQDMMAPVGGADMLGQVGELDMGDDTHDMRGGNNKRAELGLLNEPATAVYVASDVYGL